MGKLHLVCHRRISRAFSVVAPMEHEARARDLLTRTNPISYFAPYFGFKAHLDQNEKIGQDYGRTRILTIDGCSRLIVWYTSMPTKKYNVDL